MAKETTTFITPSVETTVELSPLDQYVTTFACIPWTVFYRYDLSGEKLKGALQTVATTYPVVCGRLKTHPERRVEVVVTPSSGFSYTETHSDKTLLEAIAAARVADQSAAFPSFAELPFFAATMATPATVDQDAPLFMVKLTHYKNGGCSLAATIHHTVADAQRLAELICDIAKAYRGEELTEKDHDRSKAWPDQLLTKVPVGMDPKDFPRKITTPFDTLPLPTFPEETYSVESLFFPSAVVEALKAKISENLKDVEFISQIDVVTALLWMLRCELAVMREGRTDAVKTAGDLAIHPSFFLYFVDLISKESPLIPENFFGNAYFGSLAAFPEAPNDEAKAMDLLDTAVEVATVVRKHILMMRDPAAQVMACITVYKALSEAPPYPPVVAGISSFFKMPFDRMDYGEGLPVFSYGLPSYPFADVWGGICPVANGKGMLVNHVVRTRDRDATINSAVLKELSPGVVMLSDKKPEEIAELIGL